MEETEKFAYFDLVTTTNITVTCTQFIYKSVCLYISQVRARLSNYSQSIINNYLFIYMPYNYHNNVDSKQMLTKTMVKAAKILVTTNTEK